MAEYALAGDATVYLSAIWVCPAIFGKSRIYAVFMRRTHITQTNEDYSSR